MAPNSCTTCGGGTYYGADDTQVQTDTNSAGWPQQGDNWCGVAIITAVEYYDWHKYNGSTTPPYSSQGSVVTMLNASSAISPWGQGTAGASGPGPKFKADISADTGTDPRAQAWGSWNVTPNGYYFHNWIYHTDNDTATKDFAADFGPAHGLNDPI